MSSEPELVVFEKADSQIEASIIKGILESEGIPVYVDGELLMDEFNMSQKLMNMSGISIEIAQEDLERARAIVASARDSGKAMEEEE